MFFRLRATSPESMAVFHLNNNEHSIKDEKETEELIFIKGGRPAFFAVKRMNPELAASSPQMSPEENMYQYCQTARALGRQGA